ncbi:MAG: response regulator transcription factor [Actinomycetota bacterium]
MAEREAVAARDRLVELGADAEAERALRLLEGPIRGGNGSRVPEVTRREREVLRHLAKGLTNRQIADRLVSEHTVHRHVTNILRKLDVPVADCRGRVRRAVGLARRRGRIAKTG